MFKNTMMLLTIFLVSCQSTYQTKLTCAQIKRHQIPSVEFCDISFEFNRCRCRQFDMNNWEAVGTAQDFPIEYCEGVAGPKLPDIAVDVRPRVKALAQIRRNLCGE